MLRRMRSSSSIIKATVLEILSDPLSLLVLISSIVIAVGAPALHYHQFGDATRMARDAGFSALFVGGSVLSIVATIRSVRREIETGTMAMALSNSVSRIGFFAAKTAGAFAAYLVFAVIVFLVTVITVNGAKIGSEVAERSGALVRLWGPSLAIGFLVLLFPLIVSALANRFFRVRFVLSSFLIALPSAVAGMFYRFDFEIFWRFVPAFVALAVMTGVVLLLSSTLAVSFASNIATSSAFAFIAAISPFIGNYYLVDALDRGGWISWGYVGWAFLFALPVLIALFSLGAFYADSKEIS